VCLDEVHQPSTCKETPTVHHENIDLARCDKFVERCTAQAQDAAGFSDIVYFFCVVGHIPTLPFLVTIAK